MHTVIAHILLALVALAVAVPESYAKRMGGGRSTGRQAPIARQHTPPPQRVQPAPPPASTAARPDPGRQSTQQNSPQQAIPRQAASPWGGMLGGALLGLGLGSLMSSDRDANSTNQTEGGNGTGTSASGAGDNQPAAAIPVEPVPENSMGSALLLGLLALVVFFLIRRGRARSRRH